MGGAPYVESGVAAAEADGSVEGVGFGVGLGGWRKEKVEEEEEEEEDDGGHGGYCRWELVWAWGGLPGDGYAQRR